jgi:hypothetical protein
MIRLWIVVSYAEPVVVNHGVLCWASGCELWCVILSQWLWIIVSYDICQWLWIMVCYAVTVVGITHHDSQPLAQHSTPWFTTTRSFITHHDSQPLAFVVNHGVLCWASGCESWCVILRKWLWIMTSYAEPVVLNDGVLFLLSITHHDSQQLAQHNSPRFTTTVSS